MSLNNIQLNNHLLLNLYANVLIERPASRVMSEPLVPFLGRNQKNILIVAHSKEASFLSGNELSFLTNVLAACKLDIDDVAIINQEQVSDIAYTEILQFLNSKIILLFGVDPLTFGLPINFPYFQVQQFNNCTFLYAPTLPEIESDKSLKSKLWGNLKTLLFS